MADSFELKGVDALKRKLRAVTAETKTKTGFSALRKAAKDVVAADAQRRARQFDDPKTADNIAEAITVRRDNKHYRATGDLKVSVGVRVTGRNPVYYWRFRELGTEREPARPFMRPALAENTDQVSTVFIQEYRKKIERLLAKGAKK